MTKVLAFAPLLIWFLLGLGYLVFSHQIMLAHDSHFTGIYLGNHLHCVVLGHGVISGFIAETCALD